MQYLKFTNSSYVLNDKCNFQRHFFQNHLCELSMKIFLHFANVKVNKWSIKKMIKLNNTHYCNKSRVAHFFVQNNLYFIFLLLFIYEQSLHCECHYKNVHVIYRNKSFQKWWTFLHKNFLLFHNKIRKQNLGLKKFNLLINHSTSSFQDTRGQEKSVRKTDSDQLRDVFINDKYNLEFNTYMSSCNNEILTRYWSVYIQKAIIGKYFVT